MKKWSRLTAWMLAVVIMLSNASGALALVEVDYEALMQWIQSVKEANGLGDVIWLDKGGVAVPPSTFVPTTEGPQYSSETTVNLSSFANEEDIQMLNVELGEYAKVNLVAPEAGQWLAYLADADMWVPITNEMDSTFALTYAKVMSLFAQNNGQALLCCAMANGATEVVNIQIQPETATLELTDKDYSQPEMVKSNAAYNALYAAAPAAEGDQDKYTVVIEYVFADGTQAASPWTATVEAGGDLLDFKVESPYVMGYLPETGKETVIINLENLQSDQTIRVTYEPDIVEYTIIHMQQNADNDLYTDVLTETKKDFTEQPVGGGHEKVYEGFYSLLYDTTVEIAADSSTVVEIYYDRYYYLMNFDLGGGYGVEPIYARYGAALGKIGTPTKAGYTFAGWQLGENTVATADMPTTMPAGNRTYVAKWTAQTTTFDVVYWYENADDDKFSQAGVQYDVQAAAGSVVNGETYKDYRFTDRDDTHFTYFFADENVTVNGDGSTVVNVYFKRNVYTLTFKANGKCGLENHTHSDDCYDLVCTITPHTHDDSCQLNCTHQTHELSCYNLDADDEVNKPNQITVQTPVDGQVYTYTTGNSYNRTTHYYLYLNGKWYCHHSGWNNNNDDDTNITLSACNHTTHSAACYSCGKIVHTHSDVNGACYGEICGKIAHTHGNNCDRTDRENTVKVIRAKYQADIKNQWPIKNEAGFDGTGYLWDSDSSLFPYWTISLDSMPGADITFTGSYSGKNAVIYYYVENLAGDNSGRPYNNKYYTLYKQVYTEKSGYLTQAEEFHDIPGYTQGEYTPTGIFSQWSGIAEENYLYYTRNSYTLTFSNYGKIVTGKGGTVQFEATLKTYNFTPEYPDALEKDAYVFEGWYTSPFFGDTKIDFETAKMPFNDLTLYARWVPVKHNVNIYLTKEDGVLGNKVGETQIVDHRELAENPYPDENIKPVHPASDKYTFVGWFYMDGGTEKGFDFSMPITQDLDLYAKWSSNVILPYTIHFQLVDGTPVAKSIESSGLAGTSKTFYAKYGEELYENYQTGYFPHTSSHTLTIDIEDERKNVFTFVYTPMNNVPYTVKYLEYGTGKELHATKVVNENKAMIVTETFVPIEKYMPDAYQKRLVVSSNPEDNVIIFWYTKDEEHAPVNVIHYIQNAEGEGYSEYLNATDLNGLIGQSYSTDVIAMTGYTFDHATANKTAVEPVNDKVTATVTSSGLLIELYYNRNYYPYEFRFLEQGTNKPLADPVGGTARYDAQVTQKMKEIPGYTCVNLDPKAIKIQVESGDVAVKNVATFYYTEKYSTINYEVVGPDGCGTLDRYSETIKAVTQTAAGATATPTSNAYKFVGWYLDAECTQPVTSADGTLSGDSDPKNTFIPTKDENEVWVDGTTYYAKFEMNVSTLTITKTGMQAGETAIFTVTATHETLGVQTYTITVVNGDSVTIPNLIIGTSYTVEEMGDWTWRYKSTSYEADDEAGNSGTIQTAGSKVVCTNSDRNDQWLDAEYGVHNDFASSGDGTKIQ